MADFCTRCAVEQFGNNVEPEINVEKIFEELEPGYVSSGYLCEGCGLTIIGKMEDGTMKVMRVPLDDDAEILSNWEDY
jgi:hypothetical protein